MNTQAKVILGLAGVILLAGIGLVILGTRPPPERTFKSSVKDLLPKPEEIPGWTVEYLPIADTPEMKAKVDETLNYDDAVFATFRNGVDRFSVYIAYWKPGKMPYRMVAGHTPDVCWVGGGWQTIEAHSGVVLKRQPAGSLVACESRSMKRNGLVENVVFWHLLDGEPMSYGTRGMAPWYAPLTDLTSRRLNQKPEQFFIRISSDMPFSQWAQTAIYHSLTERLPLVDSSS